MDIENKVVLITGACGLIGSELSRNVVNLGGKVLLGDVDENTGKALESELGINNSKFFNLDICQENSIDLFIKQGRKFFKKIDVAVHCAYPRTKKSAITFEDLNIEIITQDLKMQLAASIIFSQKIIKYFKSQGYGNLIHISSIQGLSAPKFAHYEDTEMISPIQYSAIKSGIISITKYLAKYLTKNSIRVNCVAPGGILAQQPESFLRKYNESCTSKGMLDPQDVVGAILFLISDESKYINGQNITVDDGWSL